MNYCHFCGGPCWSFGGCADRLRHRAALRARAEAERLLRAVSIWGAMAAALHRRDEASYSFRSDDPPIVWIPSGPTPQPRWFGDQSPHVREGWPVKP